jgi:hypothetical protein
VYPNPGTGNATINIQSPEKQRMLIELVNVAGQVVYTQRETINPGVNALQLRVRALSTGSFFIRFRNEKGEVVNQQQYQRN